MISNFMKQLYRTSNEEEKDKETIEAKFKFKTYDTVVDYVVRFRTTYGIEG